MRLNTQQVEKHSPFWSITTLCSPLWICHLQYVFFYQMTKKSVCTNIINLTVCISCALSFKGAVAWDVILKANYCLSGILRKEEIFLDFSIKICWDRQIRSIRELEEYGLCSIKRILRVEWNTFNILCTEESSLKHNLYLSFIHILYA